MTTPASTTAGAHGGTAAPHLRRWLALGVPAGIIAATVMLIMGIGANLFMVRLGTDPHYAFASADIAALALVAHLGLTPRKKAVACLSPVLRRSAEGNTLPTPGTDA